ncbi:MAG: hypothetical protein V3T72_03475 [Thermoanaerobaculia bacterium]
MRTTGTSTLVTLCLLGAAATGAQQPPADPATQIAAAVTPAPEDLRQGASVLGYSDDGQLVSLRQGDGDLVCLADNPSDERFHVACYFKQLDPFMARGRELRAEGKKRDEIVAAREAEIQAGKLEMPSQPTALYSYTGPRDSFDPETGTVTGANHVYVVYIPYATAESTGLSATPTTGAPWLMAAGKPWAHIMLVQPAPTEEAAE